MLTREEYTRNITFYGNSKQVERAKKVLSSINGLAEMSEGEARLQIQAMIDQERLEAGILYDGNTVWSRDKIIRNLKQIIKAGTLYRDGQPRYISIGRTISLPAGGRPRLTKYFYDFLSLSCGSIAHYNIQGWIAEYPTVEDLRGFFLKNEFGERVLDHLPVWETDAKKIVEEIEHLLFPFQAYMKQRQTSSLIFGVNIGYRHISIN